MQESDIQLYVDGVKHELKVAPTRMPATLMGLPYFSVSVPFKSSNTTVNMSLAAAPSADEGYRPAWGVHSLKFYTAAYVANAQGALNYVPVVEACFCSFSWRLHCFA